MPTKTTTADRLLTREEAAQFLRVTPKLMAAWHTRGYGPPSFLVGKARRYRERLLLAWLDEQSTLT